MAAAGGRLPRAPDLHRDRRGRTSCRTSAICSRPTTARRTRRARSSPRSREHINPLGWREVWGKRRISFPGFGSPRLGPVSALNLMRKRDATLRFLHVHHEDLKARDRAGRPEPRQLTGDVRQRVFPDRGAGGDAPSRPGLPRARLPARSGAGAGALASRLGFAGQQGLYPTACNQYRASMNAVADWAKAHGLMDHAGPECVPVESSLLDAAPCAIRHGSRCCSARTGSDRASR